MNSEKDCLNNIEIDDTESEDMGFQDNSNRCPKCHKELKLDMIVFFNACHHGFCKVCARELLMQDQFPRVRCPIDKQHSDHVIHYNKHVFCSMQYLYVNETTHDYLKHDIENHPSYFTSDTENKLSESVILCNEAIHYFTDKLQMFKDTLENVNKINLNSHLKNDSDKKLEIYNQIEYLSRKLQDKIHSLKSINCVHYTKYDILMEFINDRDKNGKSLFDSNNVICIFMQQYLSTFTKFISEHFRYFNEPDIFTKAFYTNSIQSVDKEIATMKDLSQFLTMISISYLKDSGYLYKMVQPKIDQVNCETCLICVKKIHGNHYGRFRKCEHKLCMACIKSLWIMEGHCPLDGDMTNQLEIVTIQTNKLNAWLHNPIKNPESTCSIKCKNPFDYLVEKFEKCSVKNFNEVFLYIVDKIKQIKSVLGDSLKLVSNLQVLLDEQSRNYRDRILIENTKITIINILKNTENCKFRYNDSISLMKFYGFVASYRIMDSKCEKCHTFDALLEARIDEFMITMKELLPFKKWLSGFEHLIDSVCIYMNDSQSDHHISKIKITIEEFLDAFESTFYLYVKPTDKHLHFTSTTSKFQSLNTFIKAKEQLDKKFEKYRSLYETIRENSESNFK